MRKIMAIAAVPGLIAGIYTFIASFFGLSMDKLGTKVFLLHFGIFALFIPLVGVERWSKGVDTISRKAALGNPQHASALSPVCCGLFRVPHFESRYIPGNHQWRICFEQSWENSRAHFRTRLSVPKAWELRFFASGWILAYFAIMMHWWFPRQDEWTVVMPD
jgi:hypothetical protein